MKKILSKRNSRLHYSPLRYPGGKTILFPLLDKVIEENKLKNMVYVEPFAGGAGAALSLLFSGKVKKIVINDLDTSIYSFWHSAIFESEKFIRKIYSTPVTIKEWRKQRDIYNNREESQQFKFGFATFYLNRTNVSGILDGGPIGGLDQKGIWKIDARFNKKNLVAKIRQIALHKNKISVSNEDGLMLINDYLEKKNAFIYLDPPYFDKGSSLYLNHYKKEDHEMLAERLNRNPEAFWLLTYDNKKEIKSLYSDRKIINYSLKYNAYKPRKGKEVIILSDTLVV